MKQVCMQVEKVFKYSCTQIFLNDEDLTVYLLCKIFYNKNKNLQIIKLPSLKNNINFS